MLGFSTELVKTAGKLDALRKLLAVGKSKAMGHIYKHPLLAMGLAGAGAGALAAGPGDRLLGGGVGLGGGLAWGHLGRKGVAERIIAERMPSHNEQLKIFAAKAVEHARPLAGVVAGAAGGFTAAKAAGIIRALRDAQAQQESSKR